MPISQQLDLNNLILSAMSVFVMTGVAVMMSRTLEEHHSIPWEAKKLLIERYGLWAVNIAEGVCPHNDVACVEREAKRLYETRILRR
jgi:hypothetical protein